MRFLSHNTLCLIIGFLLFQAISCFAFGQRESVLAEVERLIDAKEYAKALDLLVQVRKDNPELRDETQRLFDQIITVRGTQYNDKYRELIEVLNKQQDLEKAMDIIAELQGMDPNKPLASAKKSAAVLLNSGSFDSLMDRTLSLLSAGRYGQALEAYLMPISEPAKAGFDLFAADFYAAGFGDILESSVQGAVARLVEAAGGVAGRETSLAAIGSRIDQLLASGANADSVASFERMASELRAAAEAEAAVRTTAELLSALASSIAAKTRGVQDPYLRYVGLICLGRPGESEGIALAIRRLWEDKATAASRKTLESANTFFDAAAAKLQSGDPSAATAGMEEAYFRYLIAIKAMALEAAKFRPGSGWKLSEADTAQLAEALARGAAAQEKASETRGYKTLIAYRGSFDALPAGRSEQEIATGRARVQQLASDADAAAAQWSAAAGVLEKKAAFGDALVAASKSARGLSSLFGGLVAEARGRDIEYAAASSASRTAALRPVLSDSEKLRQNGSDLVEGTINGVKAANTEDTPPMRPAEGLATFASADALLVSLLGTIDGLAAAWKTDAPYVLQSDRFKAVLTDLASLREKVVAERATLARLSAGAEDQMRTAALERREAETAYANAGLALRAERFEDAQGLAFESSDLLINSLALEENAAARERLDKGIPLLLKQIDDGITEQYIRQVNTLIDEVATLYRGGEYLRASMQLEKAQEQWTETQGTRRNDTLVYWQGLVKNALELSGGRELSSDDPRASVVNSLLNLANQSYAAAEKLARTDPKRDALLKEATRTVSAVLAQGLAPLYRAARVLNLKIKKLMDDRAAAQEAAKDIAVYIAGIKNSTIKKSEAYFALLDYQEIYPTYPGMKTTIETLEYDLGIKVRPPSAEQLARSTRLVSQARDRYNPLNKLTYEGALDLLAQALALNPNSQEARALQATILTKAGGGEVAILTKGDQLKYLEAKDLADAGDNRAAYDVVRGLLVKNESYESFGPLKRLEATLKARLRI